MLCYCSLSFLSVLSRVQLRNRLSGLTKSILLTTHITNQRRMAWIDNKNLDVSLVMVGWIDGGGSYDSGRKTNHIFQDLTPQIRNPKDFASLISKLRNKGLRI